LMVMFTALLSAIIHDLDVVCSVWLPGEADAPLFVNPNAVLALAFALQQLQPIPRGNAKVFETGGCLQLIQLAQCDELHRAPQFAPSGEEEAMGVLALEGLNHGVSI
jgi:hypothetical protein